MLAVETEQIVRNNGTSPMTTRSILVPLHEMQPNQTNDFFAVLAERSKRSTRTGQPYYRLRFRDKMRSFPCVPIWQNSPLFDACDQEWKPGQHFKVRAVLQPDERFGPQLELVNVRPVQSEDEGAGYQPEQLIETSSFDANTLYDELKLHIASIEDEPLRQLVEGLIDEHREIILTHPAATKNHHAYRGGYLEHTVSVLRTDIYLADKYRTYYADLDPPLNKDLIIAGCVLHDIGKIHELSVEGDVSQYTVSGHLIGHIIMGRDMLREAAAKIEDLSPDLVLYLEHIVLSHQGMPEWGSPKEPMMPEALLVHFADDIDAKMNLFVGLIESSTEEGPFTSASNILRRRLLKDRRV